VGDKYLSRGVKNVLQKFLVHQRVKFTKCVIKALSETCLVNTTMKTQQMIKIFLGVHQEPRAYRFMKKTELKNHGTLSL
jgi:hypothetical protein